MTIDWQRVYDRVREFNMAQRAPWEDFLLHELRWTPYGRAELLRLTVAVDTAWNARAVKLGNACQRVNQHAPQILAATRQLHHLHLPLDNDPDIAHVEAVGTSVLKMIVGGGCTAGVLAMKLIHWSQPSALPALDSKAWLVINQLTGQNKTFPTEWSGEKCATAWTRAFRFYNDALSLLAPQDQSDLVQYDADTQPAGYRRGNTLVRVFDKYLWLEGVALSKAGAQGTSGITASTASVDHAPNKPTDGAREGTV